VNFLKSKGFHLSMTELSPMISRSWKQEPEYVKDTYTRLSLQAEKLYLRRGSEQQQISQLFNNERFYQANGAYLGNFTHRQLVEFALSQQNPFYDHPQIHGRSNTPRRIPLPNAGPIMGHPSSIYPSITQMRAPREREMDQVFACSASTSPTMELTQDFVEPQSNVNDFQGRDESSHLMSNNLSSLLSFEGPSLVQTCNLLATQNSNIPLVRISSDNSSDPQRRNSNTSLLPSLTSPNGQLVQQSSYPFSISLGNEAWDDTSSASLSKSQQQSFVPSEEQQEICKFEIDENTMAFNEYHMNYFDTLNSDSQSIKLSSSAPIEVFDNYSASGMLADFSPMVTS
jgi:hypothetical protein